jgi:hypothetical protein
MRGEALPAGDQTAAPGTPAAAPKATPVEKPIGQ